MAKVLLLAVAVLFCVGCSKTFTCDVYYYTTGVGWGYLFSEDYSGTSESDADDNCESSYGSYYDCRDCS